MLPYSSLALAVNSISLNVHGKGSCAAPQFHQLLNLPLQDSQRQKCACEILFPHWKDPCCALLSGQDPPGWALLAQCRLGSRGTAVKSSFCRHLSHLRCLESAQRTAAADQIDQQLIRQPCATPSLLPTGLNPAPYWLCRCSQAKLRIRCCHCQHPIHSHKSFDKTTDNITWQPSHAYDTLAGVYSTQCIGSSCEHLPEQAAHCKPLWVAHNKQLDSGIHLQA